MEMVPVFRPLIEVEELSAVREALERGWLGMGSYVKDFEEAIAEVCGLDKDSGRGVVAVNTGHAALHLSLLMMGVKPGDEVVTPSFNNAADFQAIMACGATPVFVDVDEQTLCVSPEQIRPLLSSKTKCIIAMDYDIYTCDHEELRKLSEQTGVPVLHDAAHSFGSFHNGIPIGNQHQFTMFSFDPVKSVTSIDGGAIIIDDVALLERAQALRLIGMTQPASQMYKNSRAWTYDIEEVGYRYHMSNVHAAIGLAQVKKLGEIKLSRQAVCKAYAEAFRDLDLVLAPDTDFDNVNPFLYYVRILDGRRSGFREHLLNRGIDTGIHWQPGHQFKLFENCPRGPLEVTERVGREIVSLPLHSKMDSEHVDRVIDAVVAFQ